MIGTEQSVLLTFSAAVFGVQVGDFATTDATVDSLNQRSGSLYIIRFTPTAADFTLTFPANSVVLASNTSITGPPSDVSVTGTATQPAATNVDLASLTISAGTLSPAFNAATLGYTVNVANDVTSTTVTPTTNNDGASVTVDGTAVASTATSGAINLAIGANAIVIVVTAADTTPKTYTITVFRAPATPSLALAGDTGSLPDDRITSNGRVNVTGLESGTAWIYTVNGGAVSPTFTIGTGTFFTLDEGDYAVDQVQVVQILGGAESVPAILAAVTVDETPPEITRTGAATVTQTVGDPYTDEGATATDNVDNSVVVTPDSSAVLIDTAGTYIVTYNATDAAGNDAEQVTRTVTVNPAPLSTDVDLLSLTITDNNSIAVALDPVFDADADTVDYTAEVGNEVTSVTVTAGYKTGTGTQTVTVNMISVDDEEASDPITLAVGVAEAIAIVVTATDGTTTKTYTVTVTRVAPATLSTDADLASLTISEGTLPAFAAATEGYAVSVGNDVASITVTPTVADTDASVTVDGTAVASGVASEPIDLAVGANDIAIVVTAQDGTTEKTYTVTVTRAAPVTLSTDADLSGLTISAGTLPAFAAATENYAVSVDNDVASVTLTPTTNDDGATLTVDGTAVASGAASSAIALTAGVAKAIDIVVTAQDGSAMKTYTVTVTRAASADADLSSLTISAGTLSPTFDADTLTGYTISVGSIVASTTVTPTTADTAASVTVAGTAVASGVASEPIDLAVGANAIAIVVTAEDGITTKTYTVTVTRAAATVTLSSDADLSGLTISAGTLPTFAADTTSYTVSVGNDVASVTVTPTTADTGASVTVDGTAVTSGTASGAIALTAGVAKAIAIVVTAEDGTTTKTYTVTVTRAAPATLSTDADLSGLTISAGTLSPTFAAATENYAVSVDNDVASVMLTPTTADAAATLTVAGAAVTSGATSAAIALTAGVAKAIAIVVTATDGTTTKTYTVTIDRGANTAPRITTAATQSVAENTPTTTPVVTFAADDDESNPITWALTGADAGDFTLNAASGALTLNALPNYEDPQDANADNVYEVNVIATDNGMPNESSTPFDLTITIVNADEAGAISDISGTVQVGQTLTAGTVTDPDSPDPSRPVTVTAHQWQGDSTNIDSATSATYTLTAADAGKAIQVIVTYTDGEGDGKTVTSTVTGTVTVPDTTAPTATFGTVTPSVIGMPHTVILTFDEPVTGLTPDDFIPSEDVTVNDVSGSDDTYTITFTPTVPDFVLILVEDSVDDLAGNAGPNSMVSASDTTKPTVTDFEAPNVDVIGTHTVTITFSEPVTGLMPDDFTATDATVTDVDLDTNPAAEPNTYIITFTPTAADYTLILNANSVSDLAAIPNMGPASAVSATTTDSAAAEVILSEIARAIADQNISAIVGRVERARSQPNGTGFNFAGQQMSLGGNANGGGGNSMSSTLANLMNSHGQALEDNTLDMKSLLGNSEFTMPLNAIGGGAGTGSGMTFWGSGDYRNLSGEDDDLTLDWDGDMFSLHLGVDTRITAAAIGGVALSWNEGEMDHDDGEGTSTSKDTYDTSMVSINPYLGWSNAHGEVWVTAGIGKGELESNGGSNDLSMQTLAIGGTGVVWQRAANTMRVKGEFTQSSLEVDDDGDDGNVDLNDMEVDVSRARLSLESTNTVTWGNGARIDRKVELGARHDGGDGVTGTGIELGLGLRHISASGLSIEGKLRGLLGHKGDINEWGISGTIKQSAGADGQGFSFALSPGYGDDSSDLQRLWEHGLRDVDGNASSGTTDPDGNASDAADTARTRNYSARLDARIGYGVNGFTAPSWLGSGSGIGLLTPYTAMTLSNDSNRYRLGVQWTLGDRIDFDLVGERRDAADDDNKILLKGEFRF